MSTRRTILTDTRKNDAIMEALPTLNWPIRPILGFWGSKVPQKAKMGHSLPRMPMNHRAKFDAASFILTGEIRNCTNKKQTNNNKQ